MAEYIKRSDAMKICREYSSHCFTTNDASGQDIADRIEDDIVKLPTVDAVEIVRCEECKYSEKHATQYPCSHCKNCYTDKFERRDKDA